MAQGELSAMTLDTIVSTALGKDDEDDASWDCVGEAHKRRTREVFERASELCSASDARSGELGLDILAQLGNEARPFLEEVLPIAIPFAEMSRPPPKR
jgi:hypothetical protein